MGSERGCSKTLRSKHSPGVSSESRSRTKAAAASAPHDFRERWLAGPVVSVMSEPPSLHRPWNVYP